MRDPAPVLLCGVVAAALLAWPPAIGSQPPPEIPSLETLEAQLEEMFAATVAATDGDAEPMHQLMTWGAVMMQATVLHQRRTIEGVAVAGSPEEAQEALLERWQRLRPSSGGPHLFRLFSIHDPQARVAPLLDLAARYPDDPLVLWQSAQTLRQAGESRRVVEMLEGFVARHPQRGIAHRLLAEHYGSLGNETLQGEALRRWAEAVPEDPALLSQWLAAGFGRLEPEETNRLVERFLAGSPGGDAGLQACLQLLRDRFGVHRTGAEACVARIAGESEPGSNAATQATAALAEAAVAAGDWTALIANLEALEPKARVRALVGAARSLPTPERCSERLELLRAAFDVLGPVEGTSSSPHHSIASAANACDARPEAQRLFLDLLAAAPAASAMDVVGAWAHNVNGVWRGDLPPGTAAVLEARLADSPQVGAPEVESLYRALDVVYQVADADLDRRFELLRRWQQQSPDTLRHQEVIALAWELVERDEGAEAVAVLERQLDRRFTSEAAELLWQLHAGAQDDDVDADDPAAWEQAVVRAERFAAELIASGDATRSAFGHVLTARSALYAGDAAGAERQYRAALRASEHPRDEWALEMLRALATTAGRARLAEMAQEVCAETALQTRYGGPSRCATSLLSKSGNHDALALVLDIQELPEDLRALDSLGFEAQAAGDLELAERAWRRAVELDPRDPAGWERLAVFLEKAGRGDDLEALLEQVRQVLPSAPVGLLRAVGRARTTQRRGESAIAILREARDGLPAGFDPAWIDAELREAYAVLGRQAAGKSSERPASAVSARAGARPLAGADVPPPGAGARELLAAGEALRMGSDGRYDPEAGEALFERAAATGDPFASYRLSLVRRSGPVTSDLAAIEAQAVAGDSYARYLLGTGALLGVGRERDPVEARRWLELAAEQDEPWAWHNLGYLRARGEGYPEADRAAALEAYRRAGDLGNVVSLHDFARLTLDPGSAGPLCEEGLRRLQRSAASGHPGAIAYLGKVLFYGGRECVTLDPPRARELLERAVANDDLGARYDLGLALLLEGGGGENEARALALLREVADAYEGLAVETLLFVAGTGAFGPRDPARARALLAEAASVGSNGLGHLTRESRYPPLDRFLAEGVTRLERLASRLDVPAQGMLAALLLAGPYQYRDPERGVALARAAAEAGDAWAMRALARALERGNGVERDPTESLRWTRRGAELGDSVAMYRYAVELMSGERIEPDLEAGLGWLLRAGEAGHWQAIGELGRLYADGRPGIPADPDLAVRWKRRRAQLGDAAARGWLVARGYEVR
ncbi:MAG TPA: hypothetical protein VMV46_18805 [Thermoanaerobaculia bacterium]|nr:hypothetical protein [Thermoanaerobaculia bacterium]